MNSLFYDSALYPFEVLGLRRLRSELLSQAEGEVLEIGIGTGLNLPYYPRQVNVQGIEPDVHLIKKANKRAGKFGATVLPGDAEQLDFSDNEFDTVVATLVFCTIPHPEAAINEIYRVLKPGGKLLVLEHVKRNSPIIGKAQDFLTPAWKHIAGGCHLNRDPEQDFKQAGFEQIEMRSLWKGLGKMWVLKKPDDLKKRLTPEQYRVTQHHGTEKPYQNEFWNEKRKGLYVDVVSGVPLFSSHDKLESKTGWPSFSKPINESDIIVGKNQKYWMTRNEVRSVKTDSHLGHVFEKKESPTGRYYCINSAALRFILLEEMEEEGYGEFIPLVR